MNNTVDTTSQNVATNTPTTIATKRSLETATIVMIVGIVLSVAESVLPIFQNSTGEVSWKLVGTTVATALISAGIKAITAYNAASANVAFNADPSSPKR